MKLNRKYFIGILFFAGIGFAFCQQRKIDSMFKLLSTAAEDTGKVTTLINLASEVSRSNPDSAIIFGNKALQLAGVLNWKEGMASSYHNLAVFNRVKGNYDAALELYLKALNIYNQLEKISEGKQKAVLNEKKLKTIGNIGFVYSEKGNYPMALSYYFKALKIAELSGDKKATGRNLSNIGNLYYKQKNTVKAGDYLLQSLRIFEAIGDKSSIGTLLSNMAGFYEDQRNHQKALDYCLKALKIFEESGDKNKRAFVLANIGNIYQAQNNDPKALEYYFKALELKTEVGDKNGTAIVLGNIGSFYTAVKKYKEAEVYLKKALAIDEQIGSLEGQKTRIKLLNELYEKTEQFKLAFGYFKQYIILRDSIAGEENTKKQTQMEMQYDFDKKSAADSIKNSEAKKFEEVKHQQEISRQKTFTYGGIAGFIVMIIVAGISFNAFRNKKKANVLIAQQKALVEEKQKEILDSIYYARRIQRALITNEKYIERKLNEITKRK